MITHYCPKCNQANVQARPSNYGGTYLAYVATYPSGVSYYRGTHTAADCAARLAAFEAQVAEAATAREESLAKATQAARGAALISRYKSIFGEAVLSANWDQVSSRWLPSF